MSKHLGIGGVGGVVQRLFLRSWIEYGVRLYPCPSTSRMQRAPIINELHCDLLRGSRG